MKSEWKQQEHARRATEAYKEAHKEHIKKTRETKKDAAIDINAANDKHAVWVLLPIYTHTHTYTHICTHMHTYTHHTYTHMLSTYSTLYTQKHMYTQM
jgi:hypothetical protein